MNFTSEYQNNVSVQNSIDRSEVEADRSRRDDWHLSNPRGCQVTSVNSSIVPPPLKPAGARGSSRVCSTTVNTQTRQVTSIFCTKSLRDSESELLPKSPFDLRFCHTDTIWKSAADEGKPVQYNHNIQIWWFTLVSVENIHVCLFVPFRSASSTLYEHQQNGKKSSLPIFFFRMTFNHAIQNSWLIT